MLPNIPRGLGVLQRIANHVGQNRLLPLVLVSTSARNRGEQLGVSIHGALIENTQVSISALGRRVDPAFEIPWPIRPMVGTMCRSWPSCHPDSGCSRRHPSHRIPTNLASVFEVFTVLGRVSGRPESGSCPGLIWPFVRCGLGSPPQPRRSPQGRNQSGLAQLSNLIVMAR